MVNAGALSRGSFINVGPTQSTHVDNALSIIGGHVAMLPKKATLQRFQTAVSNALLTRCSPKVGTFIMLYPRGDMRVDLFKHKILMTVD